MQLPEWFYPAVMSLILSGSYLLVLVRKELIKKDVPLKKVNVEKEDLEQYFLNKVGRHE